MEIRLGYIEQYEKGYSTRLDKKLTIKDYKTFNTSISELNNYENLKRLFEMIVLNNNEFIEFTKSESKILLENSLSVSGDKKSYYKHHLNLNRLFLNYLSSFRSFLDHTETSCKRKYGKESNETIEFKKITKTYFDENLCYRFFYKLRNFSQHCGLPIDEFELSATKISENEFRPEYNINFDTKDLLNKYSEWGTVKKDLLEIDKISIFDLLNNMISVLNSLWSELIKIFNQDIKNAVSFINTNAKFLKTENNTVCIFSDIVTDESGQMKYFQSHQIPFDLIEEIENCT